MEMPRAILFDLDETLYRERRYALSAFRAVAAAMAADMDASAAAMFRVMIRAMREGRRASALQELCAAEGWPVEVVPMLVDMIRAHRPALRLPCASRAVLEEMRASWRTAIVTNGWPGVQRRKIAALGLEALVDAVVYAAEHGTGIGKPEAAPFLAAARRLQVAPEDCVFVGDDPVRDIEGAQRLGMKTILVQRRRTGGRQGGPTVRPDIVVRSIEEVPRAASFLSREASVRCA